MEKGINFDEFTKEINIKNHNPNWPQISNHSYRLLIIGGSGSGKINALLNLIKQQAYDSFSVIDITY